MRAPLPLNQSAVEWMKPVAPGQWTDLAVGGYENEFEIGRVDRIDVEFQQSDLSTISRATGPAGVHVRVPAPRSAATTQPVTSQKRKRVCAYEITPSHDQPVIR